MLALIIKNNDTQNGFLDPIYLEVIKILENVKMRLTGLHD
jgi:hypothetical protein